MVRLSSFHTEAAYLADSQYADVEALVLSGELFNGASRSSSPSRSVIAEDEDRGWHDDEYIAAKQKEYNEKGLDYDSDAERRHMIKSKEQQEIQLQQSIGMGPGRTGVKGVIRDRDEAAQIQREKKMKEMEELKQKMEGMNLGGKTFFEEEWEKILKGEKADKLVTVDFEKLRERMETFGGKRQGKFGHLREVGLNGFLSALEKEDESVWVVVHLYDPVSDFYSHSAPLIFRKSLDRCYLIDEKLARLAREFPDVKFLRARAAALGFASLKTNKQQSGFTRLKQLREDNEDDPYADDEKDAEYEEDDETDDFRDDDVDLDMLPTMLVYRSGDLVHNWVRVDWEAGDAGLEEHLEKSVLIELSVYAIA